MLDYTVVNKDPKKTVKQKSYAFMSVECESAIKKGGYHSRFQSL